MNTTTAEKIPTRSVRRNKHVTRRNKISCIHTSREKHFFAQGKVKNPCLNQITKLSPLKVKWCNPNLLQNTLIEVKLLKNTAI